MNVKPGKNCMATLLHAQAQHMSEEVFLNLTPSQAVQLVGPAVRVGKSRCMHLYCRTAACIYK